MLHHPRRQSCLHLPRLDLIVKFRYLRQRVGRDQPDFSHARIQNANQFEVRLHVAGRHGSQLLPARRNAFLQRAFGLSADVLQAAGISAVHHNLQIRRQRLAFALPARGAHLQILRGDAVVACLRRLQKSENRPIGRVASERVGRSVRGSARGCRGFAESGLADSAPQAEDSPQH